MDASLECIICGSAMDRAHARAFCPNCGYEEDGTDLFAADGPAPSSPVVPLPPEPWTQKTLFPLDSFDAVSPPPAPTSPPEKPPRPRRMRRPPPPTGWLFPELN